jgi:tetratricopeptide (TPR) repeat protein
MEPRFLSNLGNNHFDLGSYELAQMYHEQSLAICREIDNRENEAVNLDTLGLIAHYQDRSQKAIEYYQKALAIHELIDNQKEKAFVLTHMGYVLIELNQLKEAQLALENALKIRRDLGTEVLAITTMAGLALLSLKNDQFEKAQQYTSNILSWIETNGTEGIELPVLVYLICYQVADAVANGDPRRKIDAQTILNAGHLLLEQHALRIQEPDVRRQFMENVPYNRKLQSAWLKSQ